MCCALADRSVQGYRLPSRRDALTATAATTAVAAARRTLPTESRKRGSRRGGGDTCIPRRPLAVGSTPAYIHPQVLPLPNSLPLSLPLLLYTFAVCSLIIQRFFLSPFSSKLSAPPRPVLYYTCLHVPFVNSISSCQRFLCMPFVSFCLHGGFQDDHSVPQHAIHSILPLLYFSGILTFFTLIARCSSL